LSQGNGGNGASSSRFSPFFSSASSSHRNGFSVVCARVVRPDASSASPFSFSTAAVSAAVSANARSSASSGIASGGAPANAPENSAPASEEFAAS
jgi:hypothetical protein